MKEAIQSGRILPGMSFNQKVWALCARVPKGKVTTYGEIARQLGMPGAARAVGNALNRNPYAPTVPCHRVVGSSGALTGFAGGLPKKKALLLKEGIAIEGDRVIFDGSKPRATQAEFQWNSAGTAQRRRERRVELVK